MRRTCQELITLSCSLTIVLRKDFFPIELFCDNRAVQACAQVDGENKLKHIDDEYEHCVKEYVKLNNVKSWVASAERLADIFTRALPLITHKRLTICLLNG